MRQLILIFVIFFSANSFAQKDTAAQRNFIAMQLGGQTMVSFHYEYSLIAKPHFMLNTNFGLGLNENGDSETGEKPIYGIHTGLLSLIGTKHISFEFGFIPTIYFHSSTTFVNINGWVGIRLSPKKMKGFFMAFGYTPRLYTTYSNPTNHFFNAAIGAKFGINF